MSKIFNILEQLELDNNLYFVNKFMDNLNKLCDNLEPLIISLSNPYNYYENINKIYIIFNNIKYESEKLKIYQLVNICNVVEDVLRDAIELIGPASDDLIDWLLLVQDQLILHKNDLDNGKIFLSALNPKIINIPERLNK
ncbi:hypothetical protein [Campylobacter sp. MG1]|uniref:hypothetical protein n=1 Tax=Campylobacter sp. MG1 TaxID=2976332 RepID=UPI00226CF463|nr:hypothetical protein [Campylobacter sp. MG1]